MFTPTFAAGRSIGWSTHVMEQAVPQPADPSGGPLRRSTAAAAGAPRFLSEPRRNRDEPSVGRRRNMTNMLCIR